MTAPGLPFYRQIFSELLERSAMLVMASGLGLPTIISRLLKVYGSSPRVVLVVNAAGDERLLREALLADGISAAALPVVIDANVPAPERKTLYLRGGCVFVTSRILVVDLLHGRLGRGSVAGVLLLHAHRVWEDSLEAWAVQVSCA
jgi:DNA excision repair protein ERCC-4